MSLNPLRGILKHNHPIANTEKKKVVWHKDVAEIVSKTHVIMRNGFSDDYSLPTLDRKEPLFILKRISHKLKTRLATARDSLATYFINDLSEHIQSVDKLIAEKEKLGAAFKAEEEEEAELIPTPPDPPEPDLDAWIKKKLEAGKRKEQGKD